MNVSDAWLTLRVSFGDWLIQVGHRIATDPVCAEDGCPLRIETHWGRRCPKHAPPAPLLMSDEGIRKVMRQTRDRLREIDAGEGGS